jgi:23S rRNA pseudouridine1911/1915/1917 synthase
MQENDTLIITEEEAGERLDKILAQRFADRQSRTYFHGLIEQELVLINGQPVKKRVKPKAGDEVEIQFTLTPEINLLPENIPLDILFEDEHLLIVNKPAGMVVHPATGNWSGTFVNALLYHCQQIKAEGIRPGIVHRLDKGTSGALVAAKTPLAQQRLIEAFASRKIHKEYLAICLGNPGTVEISAPLGRHPFHRQQFAVVEGGKPALSQCTSLKHNGQLSLVRVILVTGRTHQIRVHMKHLGTPVLGDQLYGSPQVNAKYGVTRQMLHAERLTFSHPISGVELDVAAPLPEEMRLFIQSIEGKK